MTVNVPATAPVLEKKLNGIQRMELVGGVFTYPEEEDWVGVAEAVTVADVKTTTDEGVSDADTPALSAKVVGVEGDDVCSCCVAVTGAVEAGEVNGAAEVDAVEDEGVLWRSVS